MNWPQNVSNGIKPSALSVGLCIFMTILYLLNMWIPINNAILLHPSALKEFQLARISFYPLAHLSTMHLVFNCISIFTPLSLFEASHGTIYTGMILNLLAITTGVIYCLIGMFMYPNTGAGGASGWIFSLLAYFAVKESSIHSHYQVYGNYKIPTLFTPLFLLLLTSVFIPGSSFWGHFFGLGLGYLMAFYEEWLYFIMLPSRIIIKIETLLDKPISMIPSFVRYYRESDVDRFIEYRSIYQEDVLPLHNDTSRGEGRVLGI